MTVIVVLEIVSGVVASEIPPNQCVQWLSTYKLKPSELIRPVLKVANKLKSCWGRHKSWQSHRETATCYFIRNVETRLGRLLG